MILYNHVTVHLHFLTQCVNKLNQILKEPVSAYKRSNQRETNDAIFFKSAKKTLNMLFTIFFFLRNH